MGMMMADLFNNEVRPGDYVIHWTDQGGRMLTVCKVIDVRDRGNGRYAVLRVMRRTKGEWVLEKTTRTEGYENRIVGISALAIPMGVWDILNKVPIKIDAKTSLYPWMRGVGDSDLTFGK
jgi:hypothetical protein